MTFSNNLKRVATIFTTIGCVFLFSVPIIILLTQSKYEFGLSIIACVMGLGILLAGSNIEICQLKYSLSNKSTSC